MTRETNADAVKRALDYADRVRATAGDLPLSENEKRMVTLAAEVHRLRKIANELSRQG